MADFTVFTDIDTLLQSNSNAAARSSLGLGTAATTASTDYATAAQGALADTSLQDGEAYTIAEIDSMLTFYPLTTEVDADLADKIDSVVTGEPAGSNLVLNAVSLTQAQYDAGTPVGTTFYIITG